MGLSGVLGVFLESFRGFGEFWVLFFGASGSFGFVSFGVSGRVFGAVSGSFWGVFWSFRSFGVVSFGVSGSFGVVFGVSRTWGISGCFLGDFGIFWGT